MEATRIPAQRLAKLVENTTCYCTRTRQREVDIGDILSLRQFDRLAGLKRPPLAIFHCHEPVPRDVQRESARWQSGQFPPTLRIGRDALPLWNCGPNGTDNSAPDRSPRIKSSDAPGQASRARLPCLHVSRLANARRWGLRSRRRALSLGSESRSNPEEDAYGCHRHASGCHRTSKEESCRNIPFTSRCSAICTSSRGPSRYWWQTPVCIPANLPITSARPADRCQMNSVPASLTRPASSTARSKSTARPACKTQPGHERIDVVWSEDVAIRSHATSAFKPSRSTLSGSVAAPLRILDESNPNDGHCSPINVSACLKTGRQSLETRPRESISHARLHDHCDPISYVVTLRRSVSAAVCCGCLVRLPLRDARYVVWGSPRRSAEGVAASQARKSADVCTKG